MHTNQPPDMTHIVFRLRTIRTAVRANELIDDPLLRRLLVEDACWGLAMADWRSRHPHRWTRARTRRQWDLEGAALARERDQLQALARRCGLPA